MSEDPLWGSGRPGAPIATVMRCQTSDGGASAEASVGERLAVAGEPARARGALSEVVVDSPLLGGFERIDGVGGEVVQRVIADRANRMGHVVTPSTSSARRRFINPLRMLLLTVLSSVPRSRAISALECPPR